MTFINLTPHTINIYDMAGNHVMDIAPSGTIARCSSSEEVIDTLDGVPILKQSFGAVQTLPAPQEGVNLIVSRLVAAAETTRTDLFCPGTLIRNEEGQPIGCRGLSRVN